MEDVKSSTYDFREKHKPGKKTLDSIELSRAANGGHVAKHHYRTEGPAYIEPEMFVFEHGQELLAHIAKHMGISGAKEEAKEKQDD